MPFTLASSFAVSSRQKREKPLDFSRLHGMHGKAFVCYGCVSRVLEGTFGLYLPAHASHALSNGSKRGFGASSFVLFCVFCKIVTAQAEKDFCLEEARIRLFTPHVRHPLFEIFYIPNRLQVDKNLNRSTQLRTNPSQVVYIEKRHPTVLRLREADMMLGSGHLADKLRLWESRLIGQQHVLLSQARHKEEGKPSHVISSDAETISCRKNSTTSADVLARWILLLGTCYAPMLSKSRDSPSRERERDSKLRRSTSRRRARPPTPICPLLRFVQFTNAHGAAEPPKGLLMHARFVLPYSPVTGFPFGSEHGIIGWGSSSSSLVLPTKVPLSHKRSCLSLQSNSGPTPSG